MPSYVSPGVYVIEKDFSQYAPSVNSSVVGLVGFASKGPTNKATLITSPNRLVDTFGPPNENINGQALEGALEILEATNSMYFVRAAGSNAADASAGVSFGGCPAVSVSNAYIGTASSVPGGTPYAGEEPHPHFTFRIQVADNGGVEKFVAPGKEFSVPSSTITANTDASSQSVALRKVIGGALHTGHVGAFFDTATAASGFIAGAYAGSGAYMSISAFSGITAGATASGATLLGAVDGSGVALGTLVSSVKVYGSHLHNSTAPKGFGYLAESLYPGTGYNLGTKSNGDTSGNSITITNANGEYFDVKVNEDGVTQETFRVSLTQYKNFIEGLINTGETNLKSDIIKGNLNASGTDFTPTELTNYINEISNMGTLGGFGITWKENDTGNTLTSVDQGNPRFVKAIAGTYGLSGGDNGTGNTDANATALIGDATGATKTGMQALDDDILNISMAAIPGISTESVQNALITLSLIHI